MQNSTGISTRELFFKKSRKHSPLSRTSYSTWGFPVLTSCLVYTAILRSMVWQVFFSELEFLTSLPHYVCVAKQKKLQNISPLHALFIQDKDNKSLLIPKTSPLLFQTQSYYRSSCTGLCL